MIAWQVCADEVESHGSVSPPVVGLEEDGFTEATLWAWPPVGPREGWVGSEANYILDGFSIW